MDTIGKVERAAELRKAREALGWSREELGRRAGLAESTVYLVERGAASDESVNSVAKALQERDFFGVPLRKAGVHLEELAKLSALPPRSIEQLERMRLDLEALRDDLDTVTKIAGAADGPSRVVKTVAASTAAADLEVVEKRASAAIASAKAVGGEVVRALALNPALEPSRRALLERFEHLDAAAWEACVKVAKTCYAIGATGTAGDVEVFAAKASVYLDRAWHLR